MQLEHVQAVRLQFDASSSSSSSFDAQQEDQRVLSQLAADEATPIKARLRAMQV
jgi:hypothetical protein